MQKGIDVSNYQGVINWKQVKDNGIRFAIIRAGYGRVASQIDPMYDRNDKECREMGLPLGVYWYSYATSPEEAEEEAKACLSVLKQRSYPLSVWYDIEDASQIPLSQKTVTAMADRFCETVEKNGYTTGIYSYEAFLESHLTEDIRKKRPICVAETGVQKTTYDMPHRMWQYSHTGRINGIAGDVDLNYLYAELPDQPTEPPTDPPAETHKTITYMVKKGDTLSGLAQRFGTTVQKLAVENGISDPNKIYAGQKLKIRTTESKPDNEIIYVVKNGDTLTRIAAKFHTTVEVLIKKNQIANSDLIYAGQKLKI